VCVCVCGRARGVGVLSLWCSCGGRLHPAATFPCVANAAQELHRLCVLLRGHPATCGHLPCPCLLTCADNDAFLSIPSRNPQGQDLPADESGMVLLHNDPGLCFGSSLLGRELYMQEVRVV
jgi:hypothetical protein